MGAWSSSLYGNDVAMDIQHGWSQGLKRGETPDALTARLVREHTLVPDAADVADEAFWLALADLQWKHGCLEPWVAARVDAIVDAPDALEGWGPRDGKARRKVQMELRARLATPKPKPKVVRPYRRDVRWPIGSVWALHQRDGAWVVMRVVGRVSGFGAGDAPRLQILDWWRFELPSPAEVAALRPALLRGVTPGMAAFPAGFADAPLYAPYTLEEGDIPTDRLQRVEGKVAAPAPTHDDTSMIPWLNWELALGFLFWRDLSAPGTLLAFRQDNGAEVLCYVGQTVCARWVSSKTGPPVVTWVTALEVLRVPVEPVPEDLMGVGVGTGVRWTSFEDRLAARARSLANLSAPTDDPSLALQRAKMMETVQANPVVPPDSSLPVRTTRKGPWPFERLRRVGGTMEPVSLGPLSIHEDRWEDLDRDLTQWGF